MIFICSSIYSSMMDFYLILDEYWMGINFLFGRCVSFYIGKDG